MGFFIAAPMDGTVLVGLTRVFAMRLVGFLFLLGAGDTCLLGCLQGLTLARMTVCATALVGLLLLVLGAVDASLLGCSQGLTLARMTLMCHGIGGLVASSIGHGRCGFVGLLARADAEENERSRRVDDCCPGEGSWYVA